MITNNRCSFIFLFILFAVTGCAPTLLPQDDSIKPILLPFRVDKISVVETRNDTATADWKLPTFVLKAQEWTAKPPFKGRLYEEAVAMIKKASYAEGIPVDVTLIINEGYYKIKGNRNGVGEHAFFQCQIKYNLKENSAYFTSAANANADLTGKFNATKSHAEQVYDITAKNAIHKALENSENALEQFKAESH
jgi:hypothetical protein